MGFGKISKRNDTFTAFRYKITSASSSARRFFVYGDQTRDFKAGDFIQVAATVYNNGTYTIASATYDTSANRTRISVVEPFTSSATEGIIDLTTKEIPWQTGDIVVTNSTKFLPTPLYPNTVYYVIRKSSTRFSLAETQQDALDGFSIVFSTNGDGYLSVAELESSFRVFGGQGNTGELWFHLAVDKSDIRSFSPPQTVVGMQNFVNLVDGYAAYQQDAGLMQAISESNDFDPVTGRLVDWRLETERFMDWAYGFRNTRLEVSDTYPVTVSPSTDILTFTTSVPIWLNGTAVSLSSPSGLPTPLIANVKYYVVLTGTPGQIKLSTSPTASDVSAIVDITSAGTGTIQIGLYDKKRVFPRFELNPNRNNLWIDTPQGVLSDVVSGPYSDIRIQQSIFDQYNRAVSATDLVVFREDKRSRIGIRPELKNDVDPLFGNDPYNYIHFGGAHLFVEGYEHFLLLNDYTVSGALLYDSFLGLSTTKYNVDYYEKTDYTLRPTLGGYYLVDNTFERNMEGAATDLQHVYDALAMSDTTAMAQHARSLIGYKGRTSFLDLLNVNSKSQFMFYRGMIQSKGSINSVKAYINSRRFIDAQLDEFWAWKLADFGDARPRVYPELNLFLTDGRRDIRLEFLGQTETATGSSEVEAEYGESVAKNFNLVTFNDTERWFDAPDQKQRIQSPLFLDAEVSSMTTIQFTASSPIPEQSSYVTYWFNTDTAHLYAFDTETNTWSIDRTNLVVSIGTKLYLQLDKACDDLRVVRRNFLTTPADYKNYTNQNLVSGTDFSLVNSSVLSLNGSVSSGIITIFTINPAATKISPARLIDKTANTVLTTVPMWDPARGNHYTQALRGISLQKPSDAAQYTTTLNGSIDNRTLNPWNFAEVGTVWWDTTLAKYKSYNDSAVYANINDRLRMWGSLADFGSIDIYEWVESTVPPSEWSNLVAAQATDNTVPQNQKATGTARSTVFRRSRALAPISIVDGRVVAPTGFVQEDDVVIFSSNDTLPTGIDPATKYTVKNLTSGTTFDLQDPDSLAAINITSVGGPAAIFIAAEFEPSDWKKQTATSVRTSAPFVAAYGNALAGVSSAITFPYNLNPTTTPYIAWVADDMADWEYAPSSTSPDLVDIYVNDVLVESGLQVSRSGQFLYVTLSSELELLQSAVVDIVRPLHVITDAELAFDADAFDDGTTTVQWKEDFEYTISTQITANVYGEPTSRTLYYFWVKDTTTRNQTINGSLSVMQASTFLAATPSPYFIVQKPKDDPESVARYASTDFTIEPYVQMPIFYRQLVVQKVSSYIDDDNRYTLQFTRDLTLRDNLTEYHRQNNVKDKHEQWVLFRKEQTSSIDYRLWNKLTEALVGYRVDTQGVKSRVPSLERELYDATHNSSTRIGLGIDQTFVDRDMGLNTVLQYLKNPTHDFSPANIDDFLEAHSFDTPEAIRESMDAIYFTFGSVYVNRIWFEVLFDSMSLNRKYHDLMKTSWIALHGVRVLEVGGLFDE